MAKVQDKIDPRDLQRWRLIEDFDRRLGLALEQEEVDESWGDKRRKLELSQYLNLYLFGLLNPVVRTMRGLCEISKDQRVREEISGHEVKLASFSEAQHLLEPKFLEKVFTDLLEQAGTTQPKGLTGNWRIIDSSLWHVLPRMVWALWRQQNTTQNAVRLHLCLDQASDLPVQAEVAPALLCERKAWQKLCRPGDAFVGDRNYGKDFSLFEELDKKGCSFVLRIMDSATQHLLEELEVTEEDRKAGVIGQAWVRLGSRASYHSMKVRVVRVQTPKEVLFLVTNKTPEQLSAELVSTLYRNRWQVELFFRWIKCILGCRHWLAESHQGVTVQIYLALIAAVLLQLHAGVRPNKRIMERIQFYLMGYTSLDELVDAVQRQLTLIKSKKLAKKI